MKTHQKILCSLAALFIGAGSSLLAADASPSSGLLGTNHFELRYFKHNLDDAPVDASGFALDANWNARPNLDLTMGYESMETDTFFGIKAERRTLLVGLRAMSSPG